MTIKIIITVLLGILFGYIYPDFSYTIDHLVTISLLLMMFFVGFDFGQDRELFKQIKKEGFSLLIYPMLIGVGSLSGALFAGLFLPLGWLPSLTCASAFGWYSLSGPLLGKLVSPELGTVAFLTNLFRELGTFFLAPLLAKSNLEKGGIKPLTFAAGGATTMDSTLPVILKVAGPKTALAAFISGAVLSMFVPFVLQLLASFLI